MTLWLKDAWWNHLQDLEDKTNQCYAKVKRDKWEVTAEKMIELRQWQCHSDQLLPILKELNVYYVPKKFQPGPMFVFPEYDVNGQATRAQTKPLHNLFGTAKYYSIGCKREEFIGPIWLGNSDRILQAVHETKTLILVEGPFDLIAARVVAPHLPIMSSLTKSIGASHEDYLKLLGVEQIVLMFDNEESKSGERSAAMLRKSISIPISTALCPDHDPSSCLKYRNKISALRSVLTGVIDD
jgi:hypothetical protein